MPSVAQPRAQVDYISERASVPTAIRTLLLGLFLAAITFSPIGPTAHAADLRLQHSTEAVGRPEATAPGPPAAFPTVTATPRATPPPINSYTPLATSTKPTATATPTITNTATPTATPFPPTQTPTATPLGDGSQPVPRTPGEACPATIEVVTKQDQYRITERATMPSDISAQVAVTGLCDATIDDLAFTWTVSITYTPSDHDPLNGPSAPIKYLWPPQRSAGSDAFSPDFGDVVRGGTLTLTTVTIIDGRLYTGRTNVSILGTNPSRDVLQAYYASDFPNSHYTLWRIAQAESNLRHFTDDGHPTWSGDQHNGVGIMQITYPAPTDDEVWSWKLNADAGSRVLQGAYANARNWPSSVARSREFSAAVDRYNATREKAELPKLARVTIPEFSSGNLLCNLQQRELDAIRLYNGAGGTDPLGLPLHEYRLAYDPTEGLLDLAVDEENLTASAQWVRVLPDERPQSGAPDYVSAVLARPAPGACR